MQLLALERDLGQVSQFPKIAKVNNQPEEMLCVRKCLESNLCTYLNDLIKIEKLFL
jgi:hypothetical protein